MQIQYTNIYAYINIYTHQGDSTMSPRSKALGISVSAPAQKSLSATIDLGDAR